MRHTPILAALALLLGCATAPPTQPPLEDASAGLEALSEAFWEESMRHSPTWATHLGDRRYDGLLDDNSQAERDRHLSATRDFLRTLDGLDASQWLPEEQITADVLRFALETDLASEVCQSHRWRVDQLAGPQVRLPQLAQSHTIRTPAEAWTLVSRYRQTSAHLQTHVAHLRSGLAQGYVAPRINVERVIRQLDAQLSVPPSESPYAQLARRQVDERGLRDEALVGPEGRGWREAVRAAIEESVYPGLATYRAFLKAELLPEAREAVGVSEIPEGARCYAARIRQSTGLSKGADEIHALGLAEVARIEGELLALIGQEGGEGIEVYLQGLGGQEGQHTTDPAELVRVNEALVARARSRLSEAFGRLPGTPLEVKAIEAFRARDAPAAYYHSAPAGGARPAIYYINTHRPETRPLYTMAALAFHEAVPGHHLQIALANENAALPRFQREIGQTAFVEGWALYSEGLAWELGLYETREERLGALSYEMWRAVRLVVDTGVHARGWSRQRALRYLMAHTGKYEEEAANEIDRTITWPGQALAYKIGQMEIQALRAEAEAALGARFDLKAFHDEVLCHGAVPLTTLRRLIEAWIVSV